MAVTRYILLLLCALGAGSAFSQEMGGGRLLPAGKSASSSTSSSGSSLDWKVEEKNTTPLLGTTPSNLFSKEKFVNTNEKYTQQQNDRLANTESSPDLLAAYAGNGGSLGNIKVKSSYVFVQYRDFAHVDGDCVRIYLNNVPIREKVVLGEANGQLRIALEPGVNTIKFEALNVGETAPNTAQLTVLDEKGNTIGGSGWNLDTGGSAILTIYRQ